MKAYIFLWENSLDIKLNGTKNETTNDLPKPMIGSFGVIRVDGRDSIVTTLNKAISFAKKQNAVGFSVGYLGTNDTDNKLCQSIIKFTRI